MLSGLLFLLRTACLPVLSLLPLLLLKLGKHALIVAVSCSTHFLPSCSGSHRLAAQGAAAQGLPPQRQVALPDHLCEPRAPCTTGLRGMSVAWCACCCCGLATACAVVCPCVACLACACCACTTAKQCPGLPSPPPTTACAAAHRPGDCQGHGLHPRVQHRWVPLRWSDGMPVCPAPAQADW